MTYLSQSNCYYSSLLFPDFCNIILQQHTPLCYVSLFSHVWIFRSFICSLLCPLCCSLSIHFTKLISTLSPLFSSIFLLSQFLPYTLSTLFLTTPWLTGGGLSERQRAVCDKFTYIPQYARGGMASINVACASAVVLQTFAIWANYRETQRLGEKFVWVS